MLTEKAKKTLRLIDNIVMNESKIEPRVIINPHFFTFLYLNH